MTETSSIYKRIDHLMTLANKGREWGKVENFSQMTGIDRTTLDNWKRRGVSRPDPETIAKIRRVTGYSTAYIMFGAEQSSSINRVLKKIRDVLYDGNVAILAAALQVPQWAVEDWIQGNGIPTSGLLSKIAELQHRADEKAERDVAERQRAGPQIAYISPTDAGEDSREPAREASSGELPRGHGERDAPTTTRLSRIDGGELVQHRGISHREPPVQSRETLDQPTRGATVGIVKSREKRPRLPLLSYAEAGRLGADHVPLDAFEVGQADEYVEYLGDRPVSGNAFALRVEGDSMHPRLIGGTDIIYVDPAVEPTTGRTVVAKNDESGEVWVKIFRRVSAEEVEFRSLNPDYPPILVHQGEPVRILGVVVGMYRPM